MTEGVQQVRQVYASTVASGGSMRDYVPPPRGKPLTEVTERREFFGLPCVGTYIRERSDAVETWRHALHDGEESYTLFYIPSSGEWWIADKYGYEVAALSPGAELIFHAWLTRKLDAA